MEGCDIAEQDATTYMFNGNYPAGSWFCKVPGIRMERKRNKTGGLSEHSLPYLNIITKGRVSYAATKSEAEAQLLKNFEETNPDYTKDETVMGESYFQDVQCIQLQ